GVPGGYGCGYTRDGEAAIFDIGPALDYTGSDVLDNGEATVFLREHAKRRAYVEPNQRLVHVLDLHHTPEKNAWTRVNHLGEEEPALQLLDAERGWLCTLNRDLLDNYLLASSSCLIRVVDVVQPNLRVWEAEDGQGLNHEQLEIHLQTR